MLAEKQNKRIECNEFGRKTKYAAWKDVDPF